jgi:oligosaccharide repeat unit polymerase
MFYSPIKIALGGIVAWLVVWLLTPVDVVGHIALGALGYAAVCYVFFVIGIALAGVNRRDLPPLAVQPWHGPIEIRLFNGSMAIGLFGMGMRLFDRLYLRGAQYGGSALDFRDTLANTAVTPVGALASALFPFCLLPLILLLASKDGVRKPWLLLLAIVLFTVPMTENLFQLSRSFLIMTLGLAFAVLVITRYNGNPFNRKLLIITLGGLVGLALASTAIFSARLEAGEFRLSDSVFDSVYAEFLQPNNAAREAINSGSDTAAFTYNAILPNGMYYLSGVYEMSVLWDRPDGQQFAYGQLLFLPFVRGASLLIDPTLLTGVDIQRYVYRDGVFQTFFGPLWIDFGWIGPLFMSLFGFIVQRLAAAVRRGSVGKLPIYAFLAVVIFFMPVVNLLVNGLGMFCVIALTAFALYVRDKPSQPRPQMIGALA